MFPQAGSESNESRWLLKALREAAHELDAQLWGLDEADLRWRPSDDGWSLKEIAAHLRDCEEHFLQSLEAIALEHEPRIAALDADALVLERDYREIDIYDTLEQLSDMRQR
ncbi:MAG: DinB family protein, partial [Chloroflexi bacterium]|nr:DinB family protein [Chloroflexota bacterium]